MKKSLVTIAVASSVLMMSGCASNNQPAPQKIVKTEKVERKVVYQKQSRTAEEIRMEKQSIQTNSLPGWILDPQIDNTGVYAIGSARVMKYDSKADRIADAIDNGRKKLAKQAIVKISSSLKKARERSVINDDINVKKGLKDNTKIMLEDVLVSGAKRINLYQDTDGIIYVHMKIDNKLLGDEMEKVMQKTKKQLMHSEHNDAIRNEMKKNLDSLMDNFEF